MENKIIEQKYALEYIKENLESLKRGNVEAKNYLYHHNTAYKDAPLIVEHGLLSFKDIQKKGIKNFTEQQMELAGDINSHINGNDGISFSVVGLTDLYKDEYEYDPKSSTAVDFLVSDELSLCRLTTHYGNEYISYKPVLPNLFKSVDIRLIRLVKEALEGSKQIDVQKIIDNYNYLIQTAIAMQTCKLDIPLREMSFEDNARLDIEKLSAQSTLKLKK